MVRSNSSQAADDAILRWNENDVSIDHPVLAGLVVDLQLTARASCPGRTADLIDVRTHQLLGMTPPQECSVDPDMVRLWYRNEQLSAAEQSLLGVIEVFAIDAHDVTDEQFEALKRHYSEREIMAIFYYASLTGAFTQLTAALGQPKE